MRVPTSPPKPVVADSAKESMMLTTKQDTKTVSDGSDALVVPIEIDAWVVNEAVLAASAAQPERDIRRWSLDYTQLPNFQSPAHVPFTNESISPTEGVYVRWHLPSSLRHASQTTTNGNPSGSMQFPLVPNRWLVVRYSGALNNRSATAWMIESDFIGDPQGSTFPDPTQVGQVTLGKCVRLTDWTETGSTQDLFLTAAANGDVSFSVFQSYNQNVFSFKDTLSNAETDDTYSYLVIGWYSNLLYDPLAQCSNLEDLQNQLNQLQWNINATSTADVLITQTLFQGMSCQVSYVLAGSAAPPSPLDSIDTSTLKIAVGSSALEALTAMVTPNSPPSTIPTVLLNALNTGLLAKLEESDGQETIAENLHRGEFSHQSGGILWTIATPPTSTSGSADTTTTILSLSTELAQQLNQLNTDQQTLEQQQEHLRKLQWDLYALWWKQGSGENADLNPNDPVAISINEALARIPLEYDTTNPQSLASQIIAQQTTVSNLMTTVTSEQTALTQALADQGISLKQINAAPMWQPKDPVLILTGLGLPPLPNPTHNSSLPCRYLSECISNITAASVPTPVDFPPALQNLLAEFFCIDSNQQNLLQKPNPFFGLSAWAQPFSPIFMEWEIAWYKIAFENWCFNGERYELNTVPDPVPNLQMINSTSLITPHATFAFKGQLKRLIDQDPTFQSEFPNWSEIEAAIDSWQILAVSLSGFHHQLVQRDIDMNRAPIASDNTPINFQELIDTQAHDTPIPGQSLFQPVRLGQFFINHMTMVDRFGQSLEIVQPDPTDNSTLPLNAASLCQPYISDALTPDQPLESNNPLRFIQLDPRVVQPMRLQADWLMPNDDANDKPLALNCQTNPIAGWLLPNYLDQSFQFFAPGGANLGELSIIENDAGTQTCQWQASFQNPYPTVEAMQPTYPWISDFLLSFVASDPTQRVADPVQAYAGLMDIIDLALTSKLDPGSQYTAYLTTLIGSIYAIARIRWQLELEQPSYQDQSWAKTCKPSMPYQKYSFPIQLGNTNSNLDGLLGYFQYDKGFNQFYSLYQPETPNPYIQSTEANRFSLIPDSRDSTIPIVTTVFINPFAQIQAYSGILPMQALQIPGLFFQSILKELKVSFRQGPLLTQDHNGIVESVISSTNQAKWSWLDPNQDGSFNALPLAPANTNACFTGQSNKIIQGFLLFNSAPLAQEENTCDARYGNPKVKQGPEQDLERQSFYHTLKHTENRESVLDASEHYFLRYAIEGFSEAECQEDMLAIRDWLETLDNRTPRQNKWHHDLMGNLSWLFMHQNSMSDLSNLVLRYPFNNMAVTAYLALCLQTNPKASSLHAFIDTCSAMTPKSPTLQACLYYAQGYVSSTKIEQLEMFLEAVKCGKNEEIEKFMKRHLQYYWVIASRNKKFLKPGSDLLVNSKNNEPHFIELLNVSWLRWVLLKSKNEASKCLSAINNVLMTTQGMDASERKQKIEDYKNTQNKYIKSSPWTENTSREALFKMIGFDDLPEEPNIIQYIGEKYGEFGLQIRPKTNSWLEHVNIKPILVQTEAFAPKVSQRSIFKSSAPEEAVKKLGSVSVISSYSGNLAQKMGSL